MNERHEFETRSLFRLLAATFTFYVVAPLSSIHKFRPVVPTTDSRLMQFVTINVIGVALLISVAQIHGQTQAEMNAVARADFERADAQLNKTYQSVLAKLRDAESKRRLRETQRAWIASRDAEAARAAKEAEGGSMAPTLRYEAMTHLTQERTKELKAMLDHRTGSGPKPVATSAPASPAATPESAQVAADAESEHDGEDSSAGLQDEFAKDYLISRNTISPDKKFAVIYPTMEAEEAANEANHPERIKNYLVGLQPFAVIKPLDTKWPYFQNESHGGLSAEWSTDNSVALVTLGGKWGPRDVFLVEFHDGKLSRIANIALKAHDLLLPNYRKAKAKRYNDLFDFVFVEDASFKLEGTSRVVIDASAETSPNLMDEDLRPSDRAWRGHVEAVWGIPQAKFISNNVSGRLRKRSKSSSEETKE